MPLPRPETVRALADAFQAIAQSLRRAAGQRNAQSEAQPVAGLFRGHDNIPLVHRDASHLFLGELALVEEPELERKTIGRLFIDLLEEESGKIGGADFLVQGTLYPDVIESVSFTGGPSVTIKSHHNVGGPPERMVRRHPFPGPALAIRVLGTITREKLDILRKADAIYLQEIENAGLYDAIWQALAVLLPVRTVGVMGDARTQDQVCALRAVTSTDGMTAHVAPSPIGFPGRVSTRIVNEVRGIDGAVYDVTSKSPGTIGWE